MATAPPAMSRTAFLAVLAIIAAMALTLNIIMLIWPVDAIRQWQAGG